MSNKKINKVLVVETLSDLYSYTYQNWYLSLKEITENVTNFDFRKYNLIYGKEKMNQMLLETIKKEKPNFVWFWLLYDEFSLETFVKIKEISPNTKTVVFFGDDDVQFETFSRYYALFFDYYFIAQPKYKQRYEAEKLKNVFPTLGVNVNILKPLDVKKIYDVTFIGRPKSIQSGRIDSIRFLKKNGIDVRIFGWGWENCNDLKENYEGPLDNNEMVKTINQSKIVLCFSKNHYGVPHLIGKVFETKACKSFALTGYDKEYSNLFKEGKEIIMFKDNKDLLKKVKYYLVNEKERNKITEAAYKRVLKDYNIKSDLINFFKIANQKKSEFKNLKIPNFNNKITLIFKEDLKTKKEELKKKLKNSEYVCFKEKGDSFLKYKNDLQAYSLEKTKKEISCCDYYINSKNLGDYLAFCAESAFNSLNRKDFNKFISIGQLMVRKDYFLNNIKKFKKAFDKNKIDFINKENTIFVSIPLVRLMDLRYTNYKHIEKAFFIKFLYNLYSLKNTSRFGFVKYLNYLLIEVIKGKTFILKEIFKNLNGRDKRKKLRKLKISREKS